MKVARFIPSASGCLINRFLLTNLLCCFWQLQKSGPGNYLVYPNTNGWINAWNRVCHAVSGRNEQSWTISWETYGVGEPCFCWSGNYPDPLHSWGLRKCLIFDACFSVSQWTSTVFPTRIGTPILNSNLRRGFRKVLRVSGLPKIRFHDLRHTAASLMLNYGVPVLIVSQRLGHSKPSITMDVYGHLMPSKQEEAADLIALWPMFEHPIAPELHLLNQKTQDVLHIWVFTDRLSLYLAPRAGLEPAT